MRDLENITGDTIPYHQWSLEKSAYKQRASSWTEPFRERRATQIPHPVYDFLFTYYNYSLGKFEQWHPKLGTKLERVAKLTPKDLRSFDKRFYRVTNTSIFLDPLLIPEKQLAHLARSLDTLEAIEKRPSYFGCYGLHEWAMVYKAKEIRHEKSVSLRLPQREVDQIVENQTILCSHFDAFRFFPKEARPFNKLQPHREQPYRFEQPGCIHANMDLFKWSYKCMPWIGSAFLEQSFDLALEAREIDMRASPYDLTAFGYAPILIETVEGRAEYEKEQRLLAKKGSNLRRQLIAFLYTIKGTNNFSV